MRTTVGDWLRKVRSHLGHLQIAAFKFSLTLCGEQHFLSIVGQAEP